MKRLLALIICVVGLNACATMQSPNYRQIQERKLAAAVRLQKEGKTSAAMESLI